MVRLRRIERLGLVRLKQGAPFHTEKRRNTGSNPVERKGGVTDSDIILLCQATRAVGNALYR